MRGRLGYGLAFVGALGVAGLPGVAAEAQPMKPSTPAAPPQPANPSEPDQPAVVPMGTPDPIRVYEPPLPEQRSYFERDTVVTIPRLSIGVFGSGTLTFDGSCSGDCPLAIIDQEVDAPDRTRFGFGLEILRSFRGPMRFGFGLHYVPRLAVKPDALIDADEEDDKALGSSLEIPLVLEGIVPTSEDVGLAIRGQFGPGFYFPGGAWAQDNQAYADFCDDHSGADKCSVRRFMRAAWTYGIGAGPVLRMGDDTALRADVLFQFTNVKLFKFKAEDRDWEARQEYRYDGYRLWLMLGLEMM